jgi:pescadillo protein
MVSRDDKRTKKKSVKAKVTSKFSTKRKLSRMGKKVKKGEAGPSTEFITRASALRRLQISLRDFRRLCILKGIYPRVPTKAPKGADKVYYDIKDISYLAHEPLLNKFRELKAFMKKVRRAAGRQEISEARRKNSIKPVFILNHLVKERYPRFIDALRDMDDSLCMIHLFASMPAQGRITAERTSACSMLLRHWQYYVARSRSLRKVFVSVKGIYYQAEIMSEQITWLVPHQFTQILPTEVDYRVMLTFLEFYETFMRFVLFKLYKSLDLEYPPTVDKTLDDAGCHLLAIKTSNVTDESAVVVSLESKGVATSAPPKKDKAAIRLSTSRLATLDKKLAELKQRESPEDEEDDEDDIESAALTGPLTDAFGELQDSVDLEEKQIFKVVEEKSASNIFQSLKFFLNREIPLPLLQMCTVSFGAQLGWDGEGSPFTSDDAGITHHVVDRPIQSKTHTREYVQPQWVFDSINAQLLLPIGRYEPGAQLPPHLSPFVDDEKEGFVPRYREDINNLKSVAGSKKTVDQGNEESDDDDDHDDGDSEVSNKEMTQKNETIEDDVKDDDMEGDHSLMKVRGPKALVYQPKEHLQTEVRQFWALYLFCIFLFFMNVVGISLFCIRSAQKGIAYSWVTFREEFHPRECN